jgi:hypothetical protein
MRKSFFADALPTLLTSILLLGAAASSARADDRFSIAIGEHGDLLVFGAKGEKLGDFPVPAISQPVTVNATTSFNVSYGRDVNEKLTAILAPNSTQPADLHFTVLGKEVDADKAAVVTLTFSRNLNSVSVDPGYVGLVQVNSEKIRHHELADDSYSPSAAPIYQPVSTATETTTTYTPAPAPRTSSDMAPRDASVTPSDRALDNSLAETTAPEAPGSQYNSAAMPSGKYLFWSEPITDANGNAPHVASDQMKLVEVQGSVSVRTPGGDVRDGTDGMLVPQGAVVSTSADSSAAIFIGGINSVRLLPNSDVAVTQHFDGTVRHTVVDLQKGTAFSRVGKREGESQRFEVRTPQGVTVATGTTLANSIVNGITFAYCNTGTIAIYYNGQYIGQLHGSGGGNIGMGSMPPNANGAAAILKAILIALQPFNTKTNEILAHEHRTPYEIAYLEAAIADALTSEGFPAGFADFIAGQVGSSVAVGLNDLVPFFKHKMTDF